MADKRIQDLSELLGISPQDRMVVEHDGQAFCMTGQTLLNTLVHAADGHGGFSTTFFKVRSDGLVDTYEATMADGTLNSFTVTNGDSGVYLGKGPVPESAQIWLDNTYSKNPSLKVRVPGGWQSIDSTTGEPAQLVSRKTEYQYDPQGVNIPTNSWLPEPPPLLKGMYLWTRVTDVWNKGEPAVTYTVSYQGQDGIGTVNSVNGKSPDASNNVTITLKDVKGDASHRTVTDTEKKSWNDGVNTAENALPKAGGRMTGSIDMNSHRITNLPDPKDPSDPVPLSMVDGLKWVDLWTNGSPNSDFAPDSYQVSGLSNYRFLAIETAFTASGGARMGLSIYPMNVGVEMRLSAFIVSPAVFLETRYFTVHGDSISFEDAYGAKATAFKAEIDNSRLVPIKIYGIK